MGDNWCVSCVRVIPVHQFHRTWCDACIETMRMRAARANPSEAPATTNYDPEFNR